MFQLSVTQRLFVMYKCFALYSAVNVIEYLKRLLLPQIWANNDL
jgi:hypothetical protein